MILLSNDMFDYIVRLLGWAVEGGTKVSQHPVCHGENLLFQTVTVITRIQGVAIPLSPPPQTNI